MPTKLSLIVLAAFLTCASLIGCSNSTPTDGSKPGETAKAKASPIVGSWEAHNKTSDGKDAKMTFEFDANGKYTMSMFPETSEVKISGPYTFENNHLKFTAEAVEMINLPKDVADKKAEIEKNFLEEAKKEDFSSDVKFDGNDKMSFSFKKDTLNLVRK